MNMTGELLFRIIFCALWLIFFASVPWVGYLTRASAGKQTTRHVDLLQVIAVALAVPYFIGSVLYALVPSWITSLSIPLPDWFRFLMLCAAAIGMSFAVWGLRVLGKNWAPSMTGVRKDTVLVTTGPYRIVRNPIYLGALTLIPSLALAAGNWLTILPGLTLCIILYTQVGKEESMLIDHFGGAYLEYMKRTPRLVPKLRQALHGHQNNDSKD